VNFKLIRITIFLFWTQFCFAQNENPPLEDSIARDNNRPSWHPESWKKPTLGLRTSISVNKVFYPEIGISLQKLIYSDEFLWFAPTVYATYGFSGKYNKHTSNVHSINLGIDYNKDGGVLGLNIAYQSDGKLTDIVISPKIGFGFSAFYFYYSYCFSTNKQAFTNFGKHQFGLIINSNQFHHKKE
jgi:hypothetical protein